MSRRGADLIRFCGIRQAAGPGRGVQGRKGGRFSLAPIISQRHGELQRARDRGKCWRPPVPGWRHRTRGSILDWTESTDLLPGRSPLASLPGPMGEEATRLHPPTPQDRAQCPPLPYPERPALPLCNRESYMQKPVGSPTLNKETVGSGPRPVITSSDGVPDGRAGAGRRIFFRARSPTNDVSLTLPIFRVGRPFRE